MIGETSIVMNHRFNGSSNHIVWNIDLQNSLYMVKMWMDNHNGEPKRQFHFCDATFDLMKGKLDHREPAFVPITNATYEMSWSLRSIVI
jgi:hypothetical protein